MTAMPATETVAAPTAATAPVHSPVTPSGVPLTDSLIERCGERAAGYDRENRFFFEDFAELRDAGYLKMAIPKDLGGYGMTLAEVCQEQRRLAYRAPATAIAVNMHLYWTGVAATLRGAGDTSLEWILREAAAGEVFAAGHGETGNDLGLSFPPRAPSVSPTGRQARRATASGDASCSAPSPRSGRAWACTA